MDDLIKRLKDGVVEHDKRWSGDTHYDLGGSANYDATEAIMAEAAAALAEAQAEIARLRALMPEVIAALDATGVNLSLVRDIRAALEAKHG